jgi:hypothetical protein
MVQTSLPDDNDALSITSFNHKMSTSTKAWFKPQVINLRIAMILVSFQCKLIGPWNKTHLTDS